MSKTSTPSLPAAIATSLEPTARVTLSERLLYSALKPMTKGRLRLQTPSGRELVFGARDESTSKELPAQAAMRVSDPAFFRRCVAYGDIGFAESYIDGEWDTPDLTAALGWFIQNLDTAPTLTGSRRRSPIGLNLLRGANRIGHLLRGNSRANSVRNISAHYDLSNDFFGLFLDPGLMYSSALWAHPSQSLAEAQSNKNETLCRDLRLSSRDHVLEIGTGWGGWAIHAAIHHGCRVTTTTLSRQQYEVAVKRIRDAGLSDRVEVLLKDYRDLDGSYDKLVSIEMLEAVGHEHHRAYFESCARLVKENGLIALQFITCPDHRYDTMRRNVDFIQKHIFPGSLLLSLNRVNALLSEAGGFCLLGMRDFGKDYARTLRIWHDTFLARLDEVRSLGFDPAFIRKWSYYLSYCEAAFALRNISVVHTLHSRPNNSSL